MLKIEAAPTPGGPAPRGRRSTERTVAAAVAAGVFVATLVGSIALIVNVTESQRHSPPTTPTPTADDVCDDEAILSGVHGTDCRPMPVVTKPGELGPANTGGPGGGTDWEPAFPGSNVWIPEETVSGRLLVHVPSSGEPPPQGYERIGQTRDGAVLYWQPHDHPDAETTDHQGR